MSTSAMPAIAADNTNFKSLRETLTKSTKTKKKKKKMLTENVAGEITKI